MLEFRRTMALILACLLVSGILLGPFGYERAYAGTGGEIYTVAGGEYGDSSDGELAVDAKMSYLSDVAIDGSGNLYIADTTNNKIRKVDAVTLRMETVAGTGGYGYAGDGGLAHDAQFRSPTGVAVDTNGNVYIADTYNNRIRKVDASGTITTFAGTGMSGDSGDNGPANEAALRSPTGVAVDGLGNVYIADSSNHRIRKVDTAGIITTIAGSENSGYAGDGGPANEARLYYPHTVAIDHAGNVFIADTYNNRIRRVDTSGGISTVAGSSSTDGYAGDGGQATDARLNGPEGVAVDTAGNLYISDTDNHRIRKVTANGHIMTIVGTGVGGYSGDGGIGTLAQIDGPTGVAIDNGGNLYFADKYNYAVRKQLPYIPSSDASLSDIGLSSGTLSPVFAPGTTTYSASVVNGVSSIRVTPTTTDALMTVKVNGISVASGSPSGDITLDVGMNTVSLEVLAEDGVTTRTYTLTIERLRSSNANLSQLSLSNGSLSPAFSSITMNYSATVNRSVIAVTPTLADPLATVKVNGMLVTSGEASPSIPLSVGHTTITVVVTAQDEATTKTYMIDVVRTISDNADLSGIALSNGTLSPVFDVDTESYTVNVSHDVSGLTVTPTVADDSATVTVDGEPVASGTASALLPLTVGSGNAITLQVTAENGATKAYTITVTRAKSSNADLAGLVLSSGDITPSFVPGTYKANVDYSVSSVTITPTVADTAYATVTVHLYDGDGASVSGPHTVENNTASPSLPLRVGNNTITVVVTAQDGTTRTYTVSVTRGASGNADLNNLTLSSGRLAPAFAGTYTASVGYSVSSVTVTPFVADADYAVVTAAVYDKNGLLTSGPHILTSGMASPALPLAVGSNEVSILVTAQDGSTKTYTVGITRADSINPDLSGLSLSSGNLSPAFQPNMISYTAHVSHGTQNVTVTLEKSDADHAATTAGIYTSEGTLINGPFVLSSGRAAFLLPLNVGRNEVQIVLRTSDDTTKTYTLAVERAASSNANLSGLVLSSGTLSPAFVPGTTSYSAIVGNTVSGVTITLTAADDNATIAVNGVVVESGGTSASLPIALGSNTITIQMTAEDGTPRTYTVIVTRTVSSNANLSALTLSSGALSPSFETGTTSYWVNVENAVDSLQITATAADDAATITVNGVAVTSGDSSGPLLLAVGSRSYTLQITAADGSTKTYSVMVTRAASNVADLHNLALSSGTLSPVFNSATTHYTVHVGNDVSGLIVVPTLSDNQATLTVNGSSVASGESSALLPLAVGSNTLVLKVTAQDGKVKNYTLMVTRAASSNATISSLSLSSGILSPAFHPGTINYTSSVKKDVSGLTVTTILSEDSSTVTVNGIPVVSGSASTLLPLTMGNNTITLEVSAADGTTQTYTVTVTREASDNADLSDLTLSSGVLTPWFVSGTYKASVGYPVNSITVTPTASDTAHASVAITLYAADEVPVSGPHQVTSGTASPSLPLVVGSNTITVQVTAENGTTKTYSITVTRGASSLTQLSQLTLSSGKLVPAFAGMYTADVEHQMSEITITPTMPEEAVATISVSLFTDNDILSGGPYAVASGTSSPSLPLIVGSNIIKIQVTAEDGMTQAYTVTVTRAASSNADLSDLALSEGTLSPAFASDLLDYTASVRNAVRSLTVTPITADAEAVVTINDTEVLSGMASAPIPLVPGRNTILVRVKAADGTWKTYTLILTRDADVSTPPYTGGGSGGPSVKEPSSSKLVINLNGRELELADIDTDKPYVALEATPIDDRVVVDISARMLTQLATRNADFFLQIDAPYGSYQVPVQLASLIPQLSEWVAKHGLQAGDVSFRIILKDVSREADLRNAASQRWPGGNIWGAVVDFHIEVLNVKSGQIIGQTDTFSKPLIRIIAMPQHLKDMPEQWGAFRYNDSTKAFEFVPATSVRIDGDLHVVIPSFSNSAYAVVSSYASFTDMERHWSQKEVELAAAKGLVEGTGQSMYEPDRAVTRAEFVAMLMRALGRNGFDRNVIPYGDVQASEWYYESVMNAKGLAILEFASLPHFLPKQPLTREEMASMLAAAVSLEHLLMPGQQDNLDLYVDAGSVNPAYLEDVRTMLRLNIMSGTGTSTFSPKGTTTRAQAAVVLIRMLRTLGWLDD